MSEKIPSARDVANARANKLRAEEIAQQDTTMPSALDVANARASAAVEQDKETNTEETAPAAESPAKEKETLDIPTSPPVGEENPSTPQETWELGEQKAVLGSEQTPKEWRERLKNLVVGAKGLLFDGRSEFFERSRAERKAEQMKAHLDGRSQELQEKAKGLGPRAIETISSVVERYNKLNWKTKLAITGVLMAGVPATAIAMPMVSSALTVALYGQRAIGAIGLGMNKRKALDAKIAANPEHWMANKPKLVKNTYAVALAMVYMVGTSYAVHEGIELLRSLGIGDLLGGAPDAPDTEPPHTESSIEAPENTADEPSVDSGQDVQSEEPPAPVSEETAPQTDASTSVESTDADSGDTASTTPEETPDNPDIKPIEAKPEGSLAAQEFGAEHARPEAAPEDLSAQEWRAEYAEPGHHTGAPDWRAEHTEADFPPETSTEAPASADVAPPEAGTAGAPHAEHLVVNAHGLSIDESHAGAYLDTQGNRIIYGGSLDAKAELAKQLVAKDHSSVVFFESTRTEKFLGLFGREVPHLSMAHWVDAGAESGVRIAEDTNDPSLIGIMLPTTNDLAQTYNPEAAADLPLPPRAEMPPIAPSPDDIPRAEMPPANTEDGFSRPEMQVDKQNISPSPEIHQHPLAHIESGSVKGEFGYSPDGAVTSFNSAGVSHGEFRTLLTDTYGEVLANRPGGNVGLARSVVENRARDIFNRMQVLDELAKRGAGGSPEADFIRKSIKFAIEQTEKMYGNVFK